jgi:hypothetical protein
LKNLIEFGHTLDLTEENPWNRKTQAPIYLSLDWDCYEIRAFTYCDNSTPEDVWNGRRTWINLPLNVDASELRSDVEKLMPVIERIAVGYRTEWDGHNNVGVFTEEAQDELNALMWDIEGGSDPDKYFTLYYEGGIIEAGNWFVDFPPEISADTTDEEIRELAARYEDDARDENVVIYGGVDEIAARFRDFRDDFRDEEQ